MLTPLSILSLDQGKLWREPAVPAPAEEAQPEPAPRPALLPAWLRAALRPAARRPA
jgi:hypothetical protein